ncbi:MAG: hypothetical protein ABIQ31_12330 [Ferruginibacter sp.]
MQKNLLFLCLYISCFSFTAFTQKDSTVYFKGATKENRDKLHRNFLQNTITGNLSLPLNEETEDNWIDAFGAIELLHFKSPWTDGRIGIAFDSITKRSIDFQRALLELAYASFRGRFTKQVTALLNNTKEAKIFAMGAEYLLLNNSLAAAGINLENKKKQLVKSEKDEAIVGQLLYSVQHRPGPTKNVLFAAITNRGFLKNRTILYSFQRKNRNFPGLALIRDSAGNFIKKENGQIFSVPQLARSINGLPGYLTNGNTPQGIFRMYGFDTSKTYFIGPTTNIQLTMPFETSLQHFFNDSTINDSIWTEEWYKKLLPPTLKNYRPLYESFYAGKAGRTEIIAHGTTVDPQYYAGEIYYPQTPTMGCLCTKEIWSDIDGRRLDSDQQKLATALQNAGGPDGYCVVVEIDDAQQPVTIDEILPLLTR